VLHVSWATVGMADVTDSGACCIVGIRALTAVHSDIFANPLGSTEAVTFFPLYFRDY
jgi:hypothetical protein